MLNKSHYLTIGIFTAVFCLIYFLLDTKTSEIKVAEKSRASSFESTNVQNLLQEARQTLRADEIGRMDAMYMRAEAATSDSAKVQAYKNLSSAWYQIKYFGIAGHYAEEVAKIDQDEMSWSIAGTTYAAGIKAESLPKVQEFCAVKARQAFEKAISINPDNLNHKINLAVTYAERPVSSDPMRGVVMLLDQNKQYPQNTSVLFHLARFGLETGQYDKAIERLETAVSIEPDNKRIICLLAEAYRTAGNTLKANEYIQRCEN